MKLELNKVYRDRIDQEWKIICKFESGNMLAVNSLQNGIIDVNKKGYYLLNGECERDLIELVGDDFTSIKEPRKFEFEAYLREFKENKNICEDDSLDVIFGYETNHLHTIPSTRCPLRGSKDSKWKITMEEIIDDI